MKLRNNLTGELIEKSEVNWGHLDKKSKEKYTVLDEAGNPVSHQEVVRFTPPELTKKAAANVEEEKKPLGGETQEQAILRLFNAGDSSTPELKNNLLKSISKEVATHYKVVESIVNKATATDK